MILMEKNSHRLQQDIFICKEALYRTMVRNIHIELDTKLSLRLQGNIILLTVVSRGK